MANSHQNEYPDASLESDENGLLQNCLDESLENPMNPELEMIIWTLYPSQSKHHISIDNHGSFDLSFLEEYN